MSEVLPKGWVISRLENCTKILDNFRKPINSKERAKRIEGKNVLDLFPYYGATGKVGYIDDFLQRGFGPTMKFSIWRWIMFAIYGRRLPPALSRVTPVTLAR